MAIRIDASGDKASRTTSLPSDTLFTVMGWVYLITNRTGQYRYFAAVESATTNATAYKLMGWSNANVFHIDSTSHVGATFAAAPSNGDWFYFALTCNGTGANNLVGYYITVAGTVYTASATASAITEAMLSVGSDSWADWNNIRIANVLVYDDALTQAEIVAQMWQYVPVRRTSIHAWWPMFGGATERLRDYSGNGRDLTAGGTLTDEPGPPIPWRLQMPTEAIQAAAAPGGNPWYAYAQQ